MSNDWKRVYDISNLPVRETTGEYLARAESRIERLLELLKRVEWFDRGYGLDRCCPFCGMLALEPREHAPHCELKAELERK